jgi:hypothetical protein
MGQLATVNFGEQVFHPTRLGVTEAPPVMKRIRGDSFHDMVVDMVVHLLAGIERLRPSATGRKHIWGTFSRLWVCRKIDAPNCCVSKIR